MALPSTAYFQWEIRTSGTLTGGGAFDSNQGTPGTDYSQQDAVHATRTDIVIDGSDSTKTTSAGDPYASDDVGNVENVTSGTGHTTGRFVCLSVSAGVATWDRSRGTTGSTGGNAVLGGAMTIANCTDAFWEGAQADGYHDANVAWFKADGTHTIPAAWTIINDGSTTIINRLVGYKTTRGDGATLANRPTIACGANVFQFDNYWRFENFIFTTTNALGIDADISGTFFNCKVTNSSGSAGREAIFLGQRGGALHCELISTLGAGIELRTNSFIFSSYIHDSNDGVTFNSGQNSMSGCIIDTMARFGVNGYTGGVVSDSIIYNCSTTGLDFTGANSSIGNNCYISDCGKGIEVDTATYTSTFKDINFYNNTTDKTNVQSHQISGETAVNPNYTDAAAGDFTTADSFHGTGQIFAGGLNTGVSATPIQITQAAGGGGGGVKQAGRGGGMAG
jgi:hypothetical protein